MRATSRTGSLSWGAETITPLLVGATVVLSNAATVAGMVSGVGPDVDVESTTGI